MCGGTGGIARGLCQYGDVLVGSGRFRSTRGTSTSAYLRVLLQIAPELDKHARLQQIRHVHERLDLCVLDLQPWLGAWVGSADVQRVASSTAAREKDAQRPQRPHRGRPRTCGFSCCCMLSNPRHSEKSLSGIAVMALSRIARVVSRSNCACLNWYSLRTAKYASRSYMPFAVCHPWKDQQGDQAGSDM